MTEEEKQARKEDMEKEKSGEGEMQKGKIKERLKEYLKDYYKKYKERQAERDKQRKERRKEIVRKMRMLEEGKGGNLLIVAEKPAI